MVRHDVATDKEKKRVRDRERKWKKERNKQSATKGGRLRGEDARMEIDNARRALARHGEKRRQALVLAQRCNKLYVGGAYWAVSSSCHNARNCGGGEEWLLGRLAIMT